MKAIFLRFGLLTIMVGLSIGLVVFTSDGQRLVSSIRQKMEKGVEVRTSLTETRVFEVVNQWRMDNKLPRLKVSESLNKAAKARLSVVVADDDFEGKITGLTTEKAVEINGYDYALVGSLYGLDLTSDDDLIDWLNKGDGREILSEKKFVDVGIAVNNNVNGKQVMIILAYRQNIKQKPQTITWGGPELWEAVNKRRIERGVNALSKRDELCTIASIRLNQLLELNNLDGHAGFVPTLDRPDLKWIKEKYDISEFLIMGYQTPLAAVDAWEHTLGHKDLLTGGQFVWGCVYAQNTFGVAITAF